jgi:hypothetical protein
MDVHVKMDTRDIDRRVVEAAKNAEKQEVQTQINNLFREARYGATEGVGRTQIREKVESMIEKLWDEDELTARLDDLVPVYFNKYLDEALQDAAKHKARKLVFLHLNNMLKEKD